MSDIQIGDNPLSIVDTIRYLNTPSEFVKDQFGIDIDKFPKQKEIINKFFLQQGNKDLYKYLILLCGMRSGKSTIVSMMCLYHLFRFLIIDDVENWFDTVLGKKLKNKGLSWICLATSEKQAMITLFSKMRDDLEQNVLAGKFFANYDFKIKKSGIIDFPGKNFMIECGPSHASGLVGRTAAFVAIDEFGHMKKSNSPPDGSDYVFSLISKSTMTLDTFGKIALLSSPVSMSDPITTKLAEAKAGEIPKCIWYHEPTWVMNPYETEENLRKMCTSEAEFLRDMAAIPSMVSYDKEKVKFFKTDFKLNDDIKNILSVNNLHVDKMTPRALGLDPASTRDSFGIATCKIVKEKIFSKKYQRTLLMDRFIIDGVKTFSAEAKGDQINPIEVSDFIFNDVIANYNIVSCGFDIWMYAEMLYNIQSTIRNKDLFKQHYLNKNDYDLFIDHVDNDKADILYNEILQDEVLRLEIINEKRVDHPKDGSKDTLDACMQSFLAAVNYATGNISFKPKKAIVSTFDYQKTVNNKNEIIRFKKI